MTRAISIAAIAISMLSATALAQNQPDATALINTSIANAEQNAKAALAYTFKENYVTTVSSGYDRSAQQVRIQQGVAGNAKSSAAPLSTGPGSDQGENGESSTQYDVLFLEGIPYRRVLSVNHQPINAESVAAESKRYDAAVAAVHAMSPEQREAYAKNGNTIAVDPKQLLTQYDCKITGHEKIQKRPATVVECKPRTDLPAASSNAASPLSPEIKLWIDDQQPFFVKTRAVLNRKIDQNRKATNVTIQWTLIDGVWHQTFTEVEWVSVQSFTDKGKSVDKFTDFKKFRTDATILPGFTPDVPPPPQP